MTHTISKDVIVMVTGLLHWRPQAYHQFVYDCGLSYLTQLCSRYPAVFSQISKSEKFWNWWKGHWELRDQEFIEACSDYNDGLEARVKMYNNLHDPDILVSGIYLNGQVLEESYANLITELTNEQYA